MAPAVAVTVGAWPKESTPPDGLIGTSLPVGRTSRVRRRALLLVLLLVVFAAGTALFFAAASGSLDRFLPGSLLSQQLVAVVEAVGHHIGPG
ncbi:MAG TPA: hypothetical protein VLR93_02310 [Patescibacteria group bacterium]|nr:hypothetical protein [Patescibacteria group bacterium]